MEAVICLGAARECSGSAPASLFTASFLPPYDGNAFKCISEEIHVCVQLHLIYYASWNLQFWRTFSWKYTIGVKTGHCICMKWAVGRYWASLYHNHSMKSFWSSYKHRRCSKDTYNLWYPSHSHPSHPIPQSLFNHLNRPWSESTSIDHQWPPMTYSI